MPLSRRLHDIALEVIQAATALATKRHGVQVILESADVVDVRSLACEVGRAFREVSPLPVFVLSGFEFESHAPLFSGYQRHTHGGIIPRDTPLVLLVEDFDQVPLTHQRQYAHLVDGDDSTNALAVGSVLLLHVAAASPTTLEGGTVDRGIWVRVPSA